MWEHPLKLHTKTTPFYIRNLSIHGFWYLWVQDSQTQSPKGTEERGQGLLWTSATPPALDTVSSTRHPTPDLLQSTVSLPGFPDPDVRNHSLPQLTCQIQLQSYWVAVFLFLEQVVVSVSATCLLHKSTVTVMNTIFYLYHSLDPLMPGSPGSYT